MTLYREFRGAEPSRKALLKARGLWKEEEQPSEEMQAEVEQLKAQSRNHLDKF